MVGAEFQYNEIVSLVMEYIPGEPLDKHILNNRKLNEQTVKLYTKQVVDAVSYMHSKFVIHRYFID